MFKKYETASLFVDPQKGFTPLCPKELPVKGGDSIVTALHKQMRCASIKTCSKDAHNRNAIWVANEEQNQFDIINSQNCDIVWNAHCIVGEEGFDLLDGLPRPNEYDFFVWKGIELNLHPYGACYHDLQEKLSTGLIEFYKDRKINCVIVGGLATDYCVQKSCEQLMNAGFHVILNLEGCRGVSPDTTREAISKLKIIGATIIENTEDLKILIEE